MVGGDPRVEVPAFKRLLRATGVDPGNAFFFRRPFSANHEKNNETSAWCNYAVNTRDTLATCEIETEDYFEANSPALICVRVRPATPGVSFPTSCIISLSTSSQRMDELAVEDVVVKEWNMNPAKLSDSGWMETTISVKTVYHIACLIGKEPTRGTRIFLTLRFVGCCDMSNTHLIAAIELLYVSFRPFVLPSQRMSSINHEIIPEATVDVGGVGAGIETVDVELTLSPTPRRVVDDNFSEEVFSEYASHSPLLIQHFRESVPALNKKCLLNEEVPPVPLRPPLLRSQFCSSDVNKDLSRDSSEDCVLAEYAIHTPNFSPPRRSVTQPRRTIYVDADDDSENDDDYDDLSSDAVEVQASPCMMPSNSSSSSSPLHYLQGAAMLEHDVISDAPILISSVTPLNSMQFNEKNGPQREVPVSPGSAIFSTNATTNTTKTTALHQDVFSLERSWDYHCEKFVNETIEDKGCGSIRMTPSTPFLSQIPFVVPDRRDFVPVSRLQRPQQNGAYSHWGDLGLYSTTKCRVSTDEIETAVVEESRRRIRNLRDVPVYEEEQDLLKAATELLGVERTSLCKGSFSRTSSTVPSRVLSTQPSVTSQQRSPSSCCTGATVNDTRQRLVSVEMQEESHSTGSEQTPTLTPTLETTKLPEEAEQNMKNIEGNSQTSINRVFKLPSTTELGSNEVKIGISSLNQYSNVLAPKPSPPVGAPQLLRYGKGRHITRQPLTDRSSEINLNLQDSKVASGGKFTVWKKTANSVTAPFPYDTTPTSSSEESDEPSLVVQVEESSSTNVPAYWENSIDVVPIYKGENLTTTTPFIGTFLVWKHHVSRSGVAKRILSLQREGDAVLLSLKKLDSSKKVSQVRLREKVEFITGLRAYHSNAIHKSGVHVAEWCLVVTCDGKQVAAVEMQSVSELHLAVQILRPLCPSNPA